MIHEILPEFTDARSRRFPVRVPTAVAGGGPGAQILLELQEPPQCCENPSWVEQVGSPFNRVGDINPVLLSSGKRLLHDQVFGRASAQRPSGIDLPDRRSTSFSPSRSRRHLRPLLHRPYARLADTLILGRAVRPDEACRNGPTHSLSCTNGACEPVRGPAFSRLAHLVHPVLPSAERDGMDGMTA